MSEPMQPTPPPPGPSYGPPPTAPPPGGPPAVAEGLPWERGKSFESLLETVKLLITAPSEAYGRMREKGDYFTPLVFAVILGWLGVLLTIVWQSLFGGLTTAMIPAQMRGDMGSAMAMRGGFLIGYAIIAPVFIVIGAFLGSAILHLFLMMFGGHRDSTAGFEGTFRVVCFSTVTNLAAIVPVAGGVVSGVWSIVLLTIGLARVHRTSQGKALSAVLTPMILCCVCVALLFGLAMAGILGMAGAMNH